MYLQRRDRRLDPLGATCADRHRRALGGAGLGDREADAARPAGDHHPFALQSEIHARCPFLHVDGRTVARAPPAVPPYGGGAARDACARPALLLRYGPATPLPSRSRPMTPPFPISRHAVPSTPSTHHHPVGTTG